MPLNKLENFIKNVEGRILYVNPNDLDATDGIENQGNSLTKPFKTIQRALIESARFSYLRGNDNDLIERTTILIYPGEHIIDNRPGFGIRNDGGVAQAVSPGGTSSGAQNTLTLTLNSNFDITQDDNILYKFNSIHGGVVVPRGTSIVGLDLRKTKIRPKYVPNPTDTNVKSSAIFRITGACYFWQFTIFDGDDTGTVYTDPTDFSTTNQSKPTFSHHKLTAFEYADGVNTLDNFSGLTDLDIYYSKLTNAYNRASSREIDQKYPADPESFAAQRPEFEIVGAFATDPLKITGIISGDGGTPGQTVTVTTSLPHEFTGGTPIKIRGVSTDNYNISTKVANVIDEKRFTYLLPFVPPNLPAGPAGGLSSANAEVVVETDTVTGASPYIFNCSMRSVYGIQGMHADGSKATGFKSMVVAQFTAVSLQKDDRAFVKYDKTGRRYDGITFSKQTGELLSSESSSTNPATTYHLDSDAVYRYDWRTSHLKLSNDAVVQIVSVFAIGFHSHFNMLSGADASITNSNSNFGQFALAADGFRKNAFAKDNKGFITSIITPRAVVTTEKEIEWLQIDTAKVSQDKVYLLGQTSQTNLPISISQGFRIGAKENDKIYIKGGGTTYEASIAMTETNVNTGVVTSTQYQAALATHQKVWEATHTPPSQTTDKSVFNIFDSGIHNISHGETIRVVAENGDLPENLDPHKTYYAITNDGDTTLGANQIRIASSRTNANLTVPVFINTIADASNRYKIISRVCDKKPGEPGHPIQWDATLGNWYINVQRMATGAGGGFIPTPNGIFNGLSSITTDDISYFNRRDDARSIDEKIYKLRYVVPKELDNGRDPIDGFVLQDSSSTNVLRDSDFTKVGIGISDYAFNRNLRFISTFDFDNVNDIVTVRSDKPHSLSVGEEIVVRNAISSTNTTAIENKGYNGTFAVASIVDEKTFTYSTTDIAGETHNVGTWAIGSAEGQQNTHTRSTLLPRFDRNNNKENLYVYRNEVITPYIKDVQDGIYHLFVVNGGNSVNDPSSEFTKIKYNQNIVNLYPEYDRDNIDPNPPEATTFAKRAPLGEVVTNHLKKSITRESTNKFLGAFDVANTITNRNNSSTSAVLTLSNEHKLGGLRYVRSNQITGGSGHTNGTYYNVKLFNGAQQPSSATWDGATAKVVVSGGAVTSAEIIEGGAAYTGGETLYFDSSPVADGGIGGAPGARISVGIENIGIGSDGYVQVTGLSTGTDAYYRIDPSVEVSSKTAIQIKKPTTVNINASVINGQRVVSLGPVGLTTGQPVFDSNAGIVTYTCARAHGLEQGNSLRLLNYEDVNLGDFVVESIDGNVGGSKTFAVKSGPYTASGVTTSFYVLKHGLSYNEAVSAKDSENVGVRGLTLYDNDQLHLDETISVSDAQFKVRLYDDGKNLGNPSQTHKIPSTSGERQTSMESRFPIGSYLQCGSEIMRVAASSFAGSGDEIKVLRGAFGTIVNVHEKDALIKKIKPLPIELRRPSILRASGHTFEYLGYGPGNYSTALPQLQDRTLTENEEYLSQSQETSCGNVVYTGMNDKGDFYIGNTKISSASGEQTSFGVPTPTITGEDPNRLSVVFDEVIVKERILVEGGSSKQILSQFDGPVTFNNSVTINNNFTLNGNFKANKGEFRDTSDATNCTTGALTVAGGVGIGKQLFVCSNANFAGITTFVGDVIFNQGLIPDTDEGAYLGSTAKPWTEAHIDEIIIGVTDNTITTATGNLILDSADGLLDINDSVDISGDLTVAGKFDLTGDLDIDGRLDVNDTTESTSVTTGAAVIDGGVGIGKNLNVGGSLTVDGDGSFAGGTVTITNNTVTATTFAGNASSADTAANLSFGSAGQVVYKDGSNNGATSANLAFDGTNLSVGGDITAFASDDRLKTNKVGITGALDKVKSLNGFTFNFNETGASLGFDKETTHAGVSAQEVQKVLPEAVTKRADDEYLTVKYEKLVPLLLEAVKELSAEVDQLKSQINN